MGRGQGTPVQALGRDSPPPFKSRRRSGGPKKVLDLLRNAKEEKQEAGVDGKRKMTKIESEENERQEREQDGATGKERRRGSPAATRHRNEGRIENVLKQDGENTQSDTEVTHLESRWRQYIF